MWVWFPMEFLAHTDCDGWRLGRGGRQRVRGRGKGKDEGRGCNRYNISRFSQLQCSSIIIIYINSIRCTPSIFYTCKDKIIFVCWGCGFASYTCTRKIKINLVTPGASIAWTLACNVVCTCTCTCSTLR